MSGEGRRAREAPLRVSSACCCGRVGEMLVGAIWGQVTRAHGPQVSPGPAGLRQPVWVGPLIAPQGSWHWRKTELEPGLVSRWTNSCLQGCLSSCAGQHCPPPHPLPAPGLRKAQAPSPLPHPVHKQPGRALCLLPPGASHALREPGVHAAPVLASGKWGVAQPPANALSSQPPEGPHLPAV